LSTTTSQSAVAISPIRLASPPYFPFFLGDVMRLLLTLILLAGTSPDPLVAVLPLVRVGLSPPPPTPSPLSSSGCSGVLTPMAPCPIGERRVVGSLNEDHLALVALASRCRPRRAAHRACSSQGVRHVAQSMPTCCCGLAQLGNGPYGRFATGHSRLVQPRAGPLCHDPTHVTRV
jgi:hypothetical protein